jgi:hypothetical protein
MFHHLLPEVRKELPVYLSALCLAPMDVTRYFHVLLDSLLSYTQTGKSQQQLIVWA